MHKPLIGLTPQWDLDKEFPWSWENYFDLISAAGGIPVLLPCDAREETIRGLVSRLDGFVFEGGEDVAPELYASALPQLCGRATPRRDAFEAALFHAARAAGKPIFGICRGIQFINVAMGGTLIEDIFHVTGSLTEHRFRPPLPPSMHRVTVVPETPLAALTQLDEFEVNSYHHQAIRDLAPGLAVMARSSTDGIIESVWAPDGPWLMAVQWHPERIFTTHPQSVQILSALIDAARTHKAL